MKVRKKTLTMPVRLSLMLLFFVLLPAFCLQLTLFRQYTDDMDSMVSKYLHRTFEMSFYAMENTLETLRIQTNYLAFSSNVEAVLAHPYHGVDRMLVRDSETIDREFVAATTLSGTFTPQMSLQVADGRIFGNWSSLRVMNQKTLARLKSEVLPYRGIRWYVTDSMLDPSLASLHSPIVMLMRECGVNAEGTVILALPTSLMNMPTSIGNEGDMITLLFDSNNQLLYSSGIDKDAYPYQVAIQACNERPFYGMSAYHNKGYYTLSNRMAGNGWLLMQVADESGTYNGMVANRNRNWQFLLTFSLIAMFFLTLSIVFGITRHIKSLDRAMQQFGQGELHAHAPIYGHGEVQDMARHFNKMVLQINELMDTVQVTEKEKTRLYYESLMAQITPHFLYNTLDSIKWTAILSNAPNVADLITSLGVLLEASTSRHSEIIPLSEELNSLRHFMNLQYARYGKRVELSIEISTELQAQKVPKFILQPLVENALIHAFDQQKSGTIQLSAYCKQGTLCIRVADNGAGMTSAAAKELALALMNKAQSSAETGVVGVHKRLLCLYGANCGITFESVLGQGSCFILHIAQNSEENALV